MSQFETLGIHRQSTREIVAHHRARNVISFDSRQPDGTPRKLLDVSRLAALGWRARTGLRDGIANAYADYLGRR